MVEDKQPIQILDLKEQYKQYGPQLEETIIDILRSGHFILGQYGAKLEKQIAEYCGVKHAVGVANGTDALEIALWCANVGPGDEVITPPFTFAATAEAIALRGATPVFVDVDPKTFNLNTDLLEKAITPKTKAILPVHLYGQPANMKPIVKLSERYGIRIVEDNAQAIGATQDGVTTGNFGDMACISFYPTKNLGAAGDAGMIVTNDDVLAERLRAVRAHGMRKRYYHDELGRNSRLDEIQAAVLVAKLPFLREWNNKRNQVAAWYNNELKHCPGVVLPTVMAGNTHVWHQYTIRVTSGSSNNADDAKLRDELAAELSARGISSMCYYPVPLHVQDAFACYGYKAGDFPVSEKLAAQVLSLPMYPELKQEQVSRVAKAITEILSSKLGAVVAPVVVAAPPFVAGI
ncbi:MAG: DegT/DnrJ/EryC1/StrS family aminotransferase [Candidatus Obscuribacterales bacterium]|nr:DegT/DnrJ/EryC1/StrS family aminotransferase [Candidatus Obscuribacterales bacterium]